MRVRTSVGFLLEWALISVLVLSGCRSPVSPDRLPGWLTSLIQQLETDPVANPPALVARYEYKNQIVYYVPPRCCDIQSDLYQSNGAILCHPDGGLTGRGDNRCPDFFAERRNEQIIWRDQRHNSGLSGGQV